MELQTTLLIIKPDAVRRQRIGAIVQRLELAGFQLVGMRMVQLSLDQARTFYQVHKERPFYDDLVTFMTSGPCVPMALRKVNAIEDLRTLIGATDSRKAACGTIRQNFGTDVQENAVHASDGPDTARTEVRFFFPDLPT